ncbi:hypothetical protein [Streptomyces sp. NPDC053427]
MSHVAVVIIAQGAASAGSTIMGMSADWDRPYRFDVWTKGAPGEPK